MSLQECTARRAEAAAEFDQHEQRTDGTQVTESLAQAFSSLRATLFKRIHEDVEEFCGRDSMLAPISVNDLQRMEAASKVEIEIYQVAVSYEEVRDRGFVRDSRWYLDWLARFRLSTLMENAQVRQRLEHYLEEARGDRRLDFGGVLIRAVPEAAKTPLVLYRLFPYSVQIATNLAFGDHLAAAEVRNRQAAILPHIVDCRECHGRPLDNGERCPVCGNPVWKFNWLRVAD